jgi:hypothetical protein
MGRGRSSTKLAVVLGKAVPDGGNCGVGRQRRDLVRQSQWASDCRLEPTRKPFCDCLQGIATTVDIRASSAAN